MVPNDIWQSYDLAELDRQYDARASVASFDAEYAKYVAVSARALADPRRIPGLVYDPTSGQNLDLYVAGPNSPLFVWIHGGYWRALSKDDNGFAALGLVERGVSVAVVNYSLVPAVTLDEIVRQVRQSVAWLNRHAAAYGCDGRRIHVGGSSAGGHLAGMLLAEGWARAAGLPEDVIGVALALSGLFDLEPVRLTKVNGWLAIDGEAARRNSPQRLIPGRTSARLIAAVGGLETDEFRRQTTDFAADWSRAGHACRTVAMPAHNHFDIALSLSEPHGALCEAVVAEIAALA